MAMEWTKKNIALLRKLYPAGKNKDPLETFGVSLSAIKSAARRYGIKKRVFSNNPWTPAKLKQLVKLYPNMRNRDIAEKLGVTESAVMAKAFKLRLLKSPAFKYECCKKGMFHKGNVPANKGKQWKDYMSAEGMESSRKSQFRKGEISINKAHYRDGDITVRVHRKTGVPYKFIRLSLREWKALHAHVWETAHGPVPKGYIVVFRDKNDTLNCELSNLELITMKENMLRNSASMNLSDGYVANCIAWRDKEVANAVLQDKGLIELKRHQLILKRTIHETSIS